MRSLASIWAIPSQYNFNFRGRITDINYINFENIEKKIKILEEKYDFLIFSYNKSSQTKKLFKSSDIFLFILNPLF